MVFYGASGHGKVVIEAWTASGGAITAIVDDNETIRRLGHFPVSGKYNPERFQSVPIIISIGDNGIRKMIVQRLDVSYGMVIHPSAVLSLSSSVDEGSVVMANAVVNADSYIGRHVIVNTGAVVDHDCRVADFAHISPNATLCGGIQVGEGTHIGAGATVIPNIKIGKWAVVGAGSVIIEDVPDYALIVGVPGKIRKFCKPHSA